MSFFFFFFVLLIFYFVYICILSRISSLSSLAFKRNHHSSPQFVFILRASLTFVSNWFPPPLHFSLRRKSMVSCDNSGTCT
uniref:Putative secreted protein n=1 Tax=Ixodes ricinus TaxID=34613 RepID=A0A147BTL7_IXORI